MKMSEAGRKFLIESARKKDIVYYHEFAKIALPETPLDTEEGRRQLKENLIAISKYEHKHNRPLLSSYAINMSKHEHGHGFYELAEELGFGNKVQLRTQQWGFIESKRVKDFWRDDTNYRKYAALSSTVAEPQPEYFTADELNFFTDWQHKPYDPNDPVHVAAKNKLMETVWKKTIYLGKMVMTQLPGFKLDAKSIWHQRGWKVEAGRKVQAAIIKPYTWVKLYREEHEHKDIFFTFGLDADPSAEALISKIDCQSSRDSRLNERQITIFREIYPERASWDFLSFENLLRLDWEELISRSVAYVTERIDDYNEIVKAVWGEQREKRAAEDTLFLQSPPVPLASPSLTASKRFKPRSTDYVKKAQRDKAVGDAGEDLVVKYEQERLSKQGLLSCVPLVKRMKDGEGFDVLSFEKEGQTKFIEVKTTTGDSHREFYLSENEVAFMKLNTDSYCIYRLYNYDPGGNVADYFIIDGDVESKIKLEPIQYAVTYHGSATKSGD